MITSADTVSWTCKFLCPFCASKHTSYVGGGLNIKCVDCGKKFRIMEIKV